MAISPLVQWEVRPGIGLATNGGGFRAGATGVDLSQSDTGNNYIDLVITNAVLSLMSSAATPFTANDVGNVIYIQSVGIPAAIAGYYEIVSVDAFNVATLDRNAAVAGTVAEHGTVGGALESLEDLVVTVVGGNTVWIKNTGTNDLLTGARTFPNGNISYPITYEGYNVVRGDLGAENWNASHYPDGWLTTTGYPVVNGQAFNQAFGNFSVLKCLSLASGCVTTAYASGGNLHLWRVKIDSTGNGAGAFGYACGQRNSIVDSDFVMSGAVTSYCIVVSATLTPIYGCRFTGTGNGINPNVGGIIVGCLFKDFTTAGSSAIKHTVTGNLCVLNSTFYNCVSCITLSAGSTTSHCVLVNNYMVNCTNGVVSLNAMDILKVAYNNRMANTVNYSGWIENSGIGDVLGAYSAGEFVDEANGDFHLSPKSPGRNVGMAYGMDIGCFQVEMEDEGSRPSCRPQAKGLPFRMRS